MQTNQFEVIESVEPDWLKRIVEKMDNQFNELSAQLEGRSRKTEAHVKKPRSEKIEAMANRKPWQNGWDIRGR